jgi:hypothetical protein
MRSDWTLADWCDQCHRKKGLVIAGSLDRVDADTVTVRFGEPLADLLLGKIDAVGASPDPSGQGWARKEWYKLLKGGCRVPLTGGSEKANNHRLLGGLRTYARLLTGEEFTYKNWIEAIRAGRTFVTNGPMLFFAVNGEDPGAIVTLPSLEKPVQITAEAQSGVPFEKLELVLNGTLLASAEAKGSPSSARIQMETKLSSAGWLAARCSGTREVVLGELSQRVSAHSSPVYVQVEGQPVRADPAVVAELDQDLIALQSWIGRRFVPGNGQHAHRLSKVLEDARAILAQRGQK